MTIEDLQKAYDILAMHHNELLNINQELNQRLMNRNIYGVTMTIEDVQKAYDILAMHHSELLNMNQELNQRLMNRSVCRLIAWKIRKLFKKDWE